MSFEFGLSKSSDMMFMRNDIRHISLARYDVSLDEMVRSLQSSLTPSFQLLDGFVGPSEYVGLSAENPSLSGSLSADPVKETIWQWIAKGLVSGASSTVARLIIQSLFLTRLYYAYGDFSEATRESLCEELRDCFENYRNFCKAYPVEHHDDKAICQIKGAHFSMSKELVSRDFYNHPWMPYETPWEFENQACLKMRQKPYRAITRHPLTNPWSKF